MVLAPVGQMTQSPDMKKEVHALLKSGRELLSKAKLHQTRKISRGLEVLADGDLQRCRPVAKIAMDGACTALSIHTLFQMSHSPVRFRLYR